MEEGGRAMYTIEKRCGKFEGNRSQLLARAVYEASLVGYADILTAGDGSSVCLVHGKRYSFLIYESQSGFVYVETYVSKREAEREFAEHERALEAEEGSEQ
jgi:hypothetical protein